MKNCEQGKVVLVLLCTKLLNREKYQALKQESSHTLIKTRHIRERTDRWDSGNKSTGDLTNVQRQNLAQQHVVETNCYKTDAHNKVLRATQIFKLSRVDIYGYISQSHIFF